jgi:hypothetical protein
MGGGIRGGLQAYVPKPNDSPFLFPGGLPDDLVRCRRVLFGLFYTVPKPAGTAA